MAALFQEDAGSLNADNSKKLNELKVTDLRNELEKRSLDKNGIKSTLVERLTAVSGDNRNCACLSVVFHWNCSLICSLD